MAHALRVACLALFVVAGFARADSSVPIATCGQSVDGNAHLVGDLACPLGAPPVVIYRGVLDLNGFTVAGDPVECEESCTIVGPGTLDAEVASQKDLAVRSLNANATLRAYDGSVKVEGCTVTNGFVVAETAARVLDSVIVGGGVGAMSEHGRVKIQDSIVRDGPSTGVFATKVVVVGSTITRHVGSGVVGYDLIYPYYRVVGTVRIIDSTIAENSNDGVRAGVLVSTRNSAIRDNAGFGVYSYEYHRSDTQHTAVGGIKVLASIITGNRVGVAGNKVFAEDSQITLNGVSGVEAEASVSVRGASDLRGNATASSCGLEDVCADVVARNTPFGVNPSNCDRSGRLTGGPGSGASPDAGNWGVCGLD